MNAEVAGYVMAWRPSSMPPEAAAFARAIVTRAAPAGRDRARSLLWAAGKLAGWAAGLGLEPVPGVLPAFLHAAGITCSQRLGDITAALDPGGEEQAVALLGGLAGSGRQ
jgi:hypothetical protein